MLSQLTATSIGMISFFTGIIIAVFVLTRKYKSYQKLLSLEQEVGRLKRDIRNICTSAVGIGQRVGLIENIIKELSLRQDQKEMRQTADAQYAHASELAHRGASVNDLIDKCGISRAEAELIRVLHQNDQVA